MLIEMSLDFVTEGKLIIFRSSSMINYFYV
jgi:hypothetical protein